MTEKKSSNLEEAKTPKYLNLLTDFGFKKMFGEENKKFLIAFLNSILAEKVGNIEDLTYLNTEQLGENHKEKKMVYDIYCQTSDKEHIIVELQIGGQSYYGERAFTYVSRLVSKEAKRGETKYHIPPIYSINILDFRMTVFHDRSNYFWEIQLKDQMNRVFLPQIKFFFIELCTFARLFKKSEYPESLHRWLYIIKNMGEENMQECPFDDPIFQDFFEQGKVDKLTTMEKEDYDKSILEYREVKDTIEYEREYARKEGKAEGLAEGEAKGLAKGLAEGEAKGIRDTAKNMLSLGLDIDTISKATGLSEEEIRNL